MHQGQLPQRQCTPDGDAEHRYKEPAKLGASDGGLRTSGKEREMLRGCSAGMKKVSFPPN